MRRHKRDLKKLDVQVVVVTFQSGPIVEAYARETRLAWPILIDSALEMYQAYGMNRGHWWSIFGPSAWWVYVKLLLRGRRLRMPSGDVSQLGGDVIVDPERIIRLHHVGDRPGDRPAIHALLDTVRRGRQR